MILAGDTSMFIFFTCINICSSIKEYISFQADPQGNHSLQNVRDTRAGHFFLGSEKLMGILDLQGDGEMGRMRAVGTKSWQCQGHGARAELQIANTTLGIQSVHLTSGPWKQVLEPYGKQLELPSRL